MNKTPKSLSKVSHPSAHFDEPHDVVEDASLSHVQKIEVLSSLEQDARQLAQASSEGMAGGERTKLSDVLEAKTDLTNSGKSASRAKRRGSR